MFRAVTQRTSDAPNASPARRGFTAVPVLGDLVAMARLLRDGGASTWAKVLVVAALVYVVCPLDAVPDAVPVVTWLDDAGIVLLARLLLRRALDPYRYPLGGPRPAASLPAAP